jgi:3-oxoacyl-[acyl-carrier protein] reductase
LEEAAENLRASYGVQVKAIACDITTPEGLQAATGACPQPDILVTNAGGPPPGDFRNFDRDDWLRALDANMLSPLL